MRPNAPNSPGSAHPPQSGSREPAVLDVQRERSNPWFEHVRKTVLLPHRDQPDVYYGLRPPDYATALVRVPTGEFLVVRQYRPIVGQYLYELPSGHVDAGE